MAKSKHGGRRKGAGRPPKKVPTISRQVYLDKDIDDWIQAQPRRNRSEIINAILRLHIKPAELKKQTKSLPEGQKENLE